MGAKVIRVNLVFTCFLSKREREDVSLKQNGISRPFVGHSFAPQITGSPTGLEQNACSDRVGNALGVFSGGSTSAPGPRCSGQQCSVWTWVSATVAHDPVPRSFLPVPRTTRTAFTLTSTRCSYLVGGKALNWKPAVLLMWSVPSDHCRSSGTCCVVFSLGLCHVQRQ